MSSSLNIFSSTGPNIEAFRTFALDESNQNKTVAKKFVDKNQLKTATSQTFQRTFGGAKEIVADFKDALVQEYGENIANFVFPATKQKATALAGLSHEVINQVLEQADQAKITQQSSEIDLNDLAAYVAVAESKNEVTQRLATTLQKLALQSPENKIITDASANAQKLAAIAKHAYEKVREAHFSIRQIQQAVQLTSQELDATALASIAESLALIQKRTTAITDAARFTTTQFASIQQLNQLSPVIQQVSQEKLQSPQQVRANANKSAIERITQASNQILVIQQNLTQCISSIKGSEDIAIQQTESIAGSAQTRALTIGMGGGLGATSSDIQQKKAQNIKNIKLGAIHDITVAYFQAKKDSYKIQQTIIQSIIDKRNARLTEQAALIKTSDSNSQEIRALNQRKNNLETTQNCIQQAIETEEAAIEWVGDKPAEIPDETLSLALKVFSAADAMKRIATQQDVSEYVTDAKSQLLSVDQSLMILLQSDLPVNHKFSSHTNITEIQNFLNTHYTNLLLAEAQSSESAKLVATDITAILLNKATEMSQKAESSLREIVDADDLDKESLQHQATTFQEITLALEAAARAYDQIADAKLIEAKGGYLEQERFQQLRQEIASAPQLASSNSLRPIIAAFDAITFSTQPPNSFDLDILSQLDSISADLNSSKITGDNGKIVLSSSLSPLTHEDRKLYYDGINLIKLALFRDFGIYAVKRFDSSFSSKINANNPLTVGELKNFLASEKQLHQSSYFITPTASLEELLSQLNSAHKERVIKSDGRHLTFNPFSNTPLAEASLVEEKKEVLEGMNAAREAIESSFSGLPKNKIESILQRFDAMVSTKAPLTVETFRSFINREVESVAKDQSTINWLWNKVFHYAEDPILNTTVWHGILLY